jgi:hypothetical protein
MKRTILALLIIFMMGCIPATPVTPDTEIADIRWWDLRACLDDVQTCNEYFFDNETVILGGHNLVVVLNAFLTSEAIRNLNGDEPVQFQYDAFGLPIIRPTSDAPDPTDMSNWDFSACFEDFKSFGTCWDLLSDNKDLILGGQSFLDVVLGVWQEAEAQK